MTSKAPPHRSEGCPAPGSPRVPRPPSGSRLPACKQGEAGREQGARRSPEQPLSVTAAARQRGRASGSGGLSLATPERSTSALAIPSSALDPSTGFPGFWAPLASEPQPAPVSDHLARTCGAALLPLSRGLCERETPVRSLTPKEAKEGAVRDGSRTVSLSSRPGVPGSHLIRGAGGPAGGS